MNKFIILILLFVVIVEVLAKVRPVPFRKQPLANYKLPQQPSNLGVVLKNCGSASDPIQFDTNVILKPNATIELGANLTIVSASGSTALTLSSVNLEKAVVIIAKAIFGVYVDIPCLDNVGSCTYTNLCTLLQNASCASFTKDYGYPCQCPFPSGAYSIPNSQDGNPLTVSLPTPPSWLDWLTSGDYCAKATLYDENGNRLVCAEIMLSLAVAV